MFKENKEGRTMWGEGIRGFQKPSLSFLFEKS